MSQSVTDQEPIDVTVEKAEAVAHELFGTAEGRQNPYPLYHRLRELAPVHISPSYGTLLSLARESSWTTWTRPGIPS